MKTLRRRIVELSFTTTRDLRVICAGYDFNGENPPTNKEINTYKNFSREAVILRILEHENYELDVPPKS